VDDIWAILTARFWEVNENLCVKSCIANFPNESTIRRAAAAIYLCYAVAREI
jgi:hypothetical protein